jgi:hypothetical protein
MIEQDHLFGLFVRLFLLSIGFKIKSINQNET